MSTSGGSNLEIVPGEVGGGGGGTGRAVTANTTTAPGGGGAVLSSSPYIRLSSLAIPVTHHQTLQQQQQQLSNHPIYQKVVDPTTTTAAAVAGLSNKSSLQKTILTSCNNPAAAEETLSFSSAGSKPIIKDTPTYEIQDNEPYIVTVRNSPARSLVKSASGPSVPSPGIGGGGGGGTVPTGLKVFSGASKAGPRLALYRSNSSLDLLDRDNYLNNQARAFHHSHLHQLSPQQRVQLMNAAAAQNHPHLIQNQVHGSNNNGTVHGSVGVTTGCFTRRKDFGSHGSIDVLSAQNASLLSGGGGHTVRSGSVGTGTARPFLSLMNPDGLLHSSKTGEQVDGGSVSGNIEDSKSLPVSSSKVSGVSVRETASPRLRLKFQKLWEHGSSKDKNSSGSSSNNGNEKGMGNIVTSTTASSTAASSNKTEGKQLFRKFRGVSSASRQQASKSLPETSKFDTTSIHIEASDGVTTKVVLRHGGTNPMEERFRRRALAHFDCQSISANISYAARLRGLLSKRRNTTTGASAASLCQRSPPESNGASDSINNGGSSSGGMSPSSSGHTLSLGQLQSSSHNNNPASASATSSSSNLQVPNQPDADLGDGKQNTLVHSCPYFRNEVGGEQERVVALTRVLRTGIAPSKSVTGYRNIGIYGKADDLDVMGKGPFVSPAEEATHRPTSCRNLALLEFRNGATHWQHGVCPYANNLQNNKQNMLEAVDIGATYYRDYFYKQDHENWFGLDENLGPLAISIRKERIDNQLYSNVYEGKSSNTVSAGSKHLYRLIVRSTELNTIRGSILEESIPGIKPSSKGGVHAKDVIDFLLPEIQLSCLKLGTPTTQTEEQLLKLDEQVLTNRHKVGIMYCKKGQSTEEEMYNNESAGPAFNEFLDLIGTRVRLKGFDKYTGGLDNKDDSTGLHSVYSQYQGCEVIFHVSTLLPFTPNNRQQLMRKRHIGNDIVTIVFQEPGALPFTPKNIRSQFQHVFIIVRANNPCSESTSYSVSVSRSREVPLFGPPIPATAKFYKNQDFVDFLMAKVINAENATYRSEKFTTMATRTRQEYLKDLVTNFTTSTPIDPRPKFSINPFGGKKKDFSKPLRFIGDSTLQGALSWTVYLEDVHKGCRVDAFFGVSCDTIVIIDATTREAVFAISCSSVLGWNTSSPNTLKLYYHQGECVTIYGKDSHSLADNDLQEIVTRLESVTTGCETKEYILGRNDAGQLGFHVQQDGVVTEIENSGCASHVGLRQGSRLVEVCKVAVATLNQEQMIDMLKNSNPVKVLVIPPSINNTTRRGCDSKHCIFTMEPECEYNSNMHLKNGVREDGESSYSKSPHPHFKSNVVNSHRKRYEPRSFSPPRSSCFSSNSSGYGTGSSSKSFSSGNGDPLLHHVSPHLEGDASASSSSGGLSGEDKWYDLNDNIKDSQCQPGSEPTCTPPPVPARAPATPAQLNHSQLSIHQANKNNGTSNLNGTLIHPREQFGGQGAVNGYRGDSLKHSASMNNGASPAVSGLLDRSFLVKRDYFQRSAPHHGSFHTKLSPSRSHDMLHLKNLYGLNQLRPFPGSSVGLDQTSNGGGGNIGMVASRSAYLTPQAPRLTREKSHLGTPMSNGYPVSVPENTIRGKMTYLTDFPLTHSCSSEQIQSVGMRKDDLAAIKNERLAAIKQAYQEKHRDRRFKKEASPILNGNERRDSSSPDDEIIPQKTRPVSLNANRLTNGASPKISSEVKLRNNNQSSRNNQNRTSTLQEDLIRLISPEYISASSGSDNGIETSDDTTPDNITPPPPAVSLMSSSTPTTPLKSSRPISMGADAPSSELYSMRLSAVGSTSPKYISPQRQSWSTSEGGDDKKTYQQMSSSASVNSELSAGEAQTNGMRSKSPVKHPYSTNLYSEPRTSMGGSSAASTSSQGSFRVTPSVSVGHWVKDEQKVPSDESERGSASPAVPFENVFNLEARVSQLEAELRKEQQSKQVLAAKVANLQEENRRLQEESHSTQDQFIKFKEWLMHTVEGQEGEEDC